MDLSVEELIKLQNKLENQYDQISQNNEDELEKAYAVLQEAKSALADDWDAKVEDCRKMIAEIELSTQELLRISTRMSQMQKIWIDFMEEDDLQHKDVVADYSLQTEALLNKAYETDYVSKLENKLLKSYSIDFLGILNHDSRAIFEMLRVVDIAAENLQNAYICYVFSKRSKSHSTIDCTERREQASQNPDENNVAHEKNVYKSRLHIVGKRGLAIIGLIIAIGIIGYFLKDSVKAYEISFKTIINAAKWFLKEHRLVILLIGTGITLLCFLRCCSFVLNYRKPGEQHIYCVKAGKGLKNEVLKNELRQIVATIDSSSEEVIEDLLTKISSCIEYHEKQLVEAHKKEIADVRNEYKVILDSFGFDKYTMDSIKRISSQIKTESEEKIEEYAEQIRALVNKDREKQLYVKKEQEMNNLYPSVFKYISDDAKQFLITGTLIMDKFRNQAGCEFSSVCLMLSKAVEAEFKIRYFVSYKVYLQEMFSENLREWPYVMRYKNKPKEVCTLGDFPFIMGQRRSEYDEDFNKTKNCFIAYVGAIQLEESLCRDEIEDILTMQANNLEEIRRNYRNPSAHVEAVSLQDAEECICLILTRDRVFEKLMRYFRGVDKTTIPRGLED